MEPIIHLLCGEGAWPVDPPPRQLNRHRAKHARRG
jgi:hypothetical protein